jgi:prepilin-type N-terminal cleavage/methylation domain-containing protein
MKQIKGFTLIEMLVVLMIIAIILPATFTILYNIMQQQVKLHKLTEAKRQGDYVMSFIKDTILTDIKGIQDGPDVTATAICANVGVISTTNDGAGWHFIHKNSIPGSTPETLQFAIVGTNVVYTDPLDVQSNLNSTQVQITREGSLPFIECFKKSNEVLPLIHINYRVTYTDTEPANRKTQLFYTTRIRLRNE